MQVNVDEFGRNIPGDAANEPSIAIDPTDPCNLVIGWRQFDSVLSDFRQAGVGYSHDAGETWFFSGSLTPGLFGSDPVLGADGSGVFYYVSLGLYFHGVGQDELRLFRSFDGGVTWDVPIQVSPGFVDKPWMTIDTTGGPGAGNIYVMARSVLEISRSTDGGLTFEHFLPFASVTGTIAVSQDGDLFRTGSSASWEYAGAQDPESEITLGTLTEFSRVMCPGPNEQAPDAEPSWLLPNEDGLLGQPWIAVDRSGGATHGFIYVVTGGGCRESKDPADTILVRSTDGGLSFSDPIRLNDDPFRVDAWQWFWTMSLAPNGRIDAVWNDTRRFLVGNLSEVYYSYSNDAGVSWSRNIPVSRVFDSHVGWPMDHKLGDYYHMISDDAAANLAYAATFNGEQDVYFLRIGDCNDNGIHDSSDITNGTSRDANANTVPDECERGDFTGDIAVDYADLQMFTSCQTWPNDVPSTESRKKRGFSRPSQPVCTLGDFDTDGDVDLSDFANFQTTFDLAAAKPPWS